ncbi:MAG: hypothetical protein ACREKM_00340 [Longimicrobiales bacterium]
MRIRSLLVPVLAAILAAGCRQSREEASAQTAAPPPSAALAPLGAAHTVDQALELLAVELNTAIETGLDETGAASIVRAEAITDRLLETRVPFEWIADDRYLVDSRIRQIQADADRIVAQVQSGVSQDTVLAAVGALAAQVNGLRRALQENGGPAPPSLEMLLEGDTLPQVVPGG